jgi:hypothetical protein
MTKTRHLFAFMAALASLLSANTASAQNVHSWVSASTGSGTTCTRAVPCGSVFTALNNTIPGGVISLLDQGAGESGQINITKSITIRAEGVEGGDAAQPLGGGGWIIVQAGAADVVTLEGLYVAGAGITFQSGGHLHVVRCSMGNDNVAGQSGIKFQPSGASKLSVTDTIIANFGLGTGGGIVINPQSGGSAQVNLKRVTVNGNAFGIAADGSNSTAGINMTIADSMIGGNVNDGIIATTPSGGAPIGVMVTNSESVNNGFGIRSIGPNVTVRVENSKVIGNGTGVTSLNGGGLVTFGNNVVQANGSNGGFTAVAGLQ